MGKEARRQKLEPLVVRLPPELHAELKALAEAEDRSMAGIMRIATQRFLAEHRVA